MYPTFKFGLKYCIAYFAFIFFYNYSRINQYSSTKILSITRDNLFTYLHMFIFFNFRNVAKTF